jgi:predicted nuclease of restriction endonuclease-like (RecB) superfamily
MKFSNLVNSIQETHSFLQEVAAKAVNTPMTIRNWLIGYYIVEFEQNGEDRAKYGDNLINELVEKLNGSLYGISATNLRLYRQFYNIYPEIIQAVSEYFKQLPNVQTASEQLQINLAVNDEPNESSIDSIHQTVSDKSVDDNNDKIRQTVSDKFQLTIYGAIDKLAKDTDVTKKYGLAPEKLLKLLSFSHIVELVKVDDELKRAFYEIECAKGVWSVRELKRQIESLYFERSGLSKDKEKLSAMVQQQAVILQAKDIINTPFAIEFLGLNQQALVSETDLEQAIIDHLINFLRELGQGFCFEDRQKRILIDDEYHFIDLVFYHRILKCHVLIDLKTEKFKHGHAGQINAYLNYYKNEVMQPDDNLPIGILLCTDKGNTMVKYATAGLDQNIFVQKYMVALPDKKELEAYLRKEMQ